MLQNEHKEVKVDEILGREEAEKAIKEAMVRISTLHCVPVAWLYVRVHTGVAAMQQRLSRRQHLGCMRGDPCSLVAHYTVLLEEHPLPACSLPADSLKSTCSRINSRSCLQALYTEHYVPKRAR